MQYVIGFNYTLKSDQGEIIDQGHGENALYFLTGVGHIIEGLENELINMNKGEKKEVKIPHNEAYGPRRDEFIVKVAKNQFPDAEGELQIGDQFKPEQEENPGQIFTVIDINDTEVTLDGNHPMAGIDLNFSVEVIEKREPTSEEIDHGHAHGPNFKGH